MQALNIEELEKNMCISFSLFSNKIYKKNTPFFTVKVDEKKVSFFIHAVFATQAIDSGLIDYDELIDGIIIKLRNTIECHYGDDGRG